MGVRAEGRGFETIFKHIVVYSTLCVLPLWIWCGGGTTTKSYNKFLFSWPLSQPSKVFPLLLLVLSLWGRQGLVSGSPGRLFVCGAPFPVQRADSEDRLPPGPGQLHNKQLEG